VRAAPRALTPEQFAQNPQRQNPATKFAKEARNYDYTRGALTLRTPLGDNRVFSGRPTQHQDLDHPLSFAVIDDTTYSYSTELRYIRPRRSSAAAIAFTAGFSSSARGRTDAGFQNVNGDRGSMIKNQVNVANTFGMYARTSTTSCPPCRS
jgi:hypothetical protein